MEILHKYRHYIYKSWIAILFLVIVSVIGAVLLFIQPFLFAIIYDRLIPTYDSKLLFIIVFSFLIILFGSVATNVLSEILTSHIRGSLIQQIRHSITSKMLRSQLSFFKNHEIGDLVQRTIQEVDTLCTSLSMMIKSISGIIQIGIISFATLFYNKFFFAICLAAMFIYVFLQISLKTKIVSHTSKIQKHNATLISSIFETIQNIKTIKVFNIKNKRVNRVQEIVDLIVAESTKSSIYKSILSIAPKVIDFALIGILVYSHHLITRGEMTIGFYLLFSAMITRMIYPLNFLIELNNHYRNGLVSDKRLDVFKDIHDENNGRVKLKTAIKSLTFNDVYFSYEQHKPILKNINISIQTGKTYAIVGRSGSGKSTLLNLITRVLIPKKGIIKVNDQPLHAFDIDDYRRHIGVVSQDFFLFNDTIANNINPNGKLSSERIQSVLSSVDLNTFFNQLDRNIGDNGWGLSGGERQRLSIARMIANSSDILLFDEATSNLDPKTESAILDILFRINTNIFDGILILVTHRPDVLTRVDQVIYVSEGSIADIGSHEYLIQKCPSYSHDLEV